MNSWVHTTTSNGSEFNRYEYASNDILQLQQPQSGMMESITQASRKRCYAYSTGGRLFWAMSILQCFNSLALWCMCWPEPSSRCIPQQGPLLILFEVLSKEQSRSGLACLSGIPSKLLKEHYASWYGCSEHVDQDSWLCHQTSVHNTNTAKGTAVSTVRAEQPH